MNLILHTNIHVIHNLQAKCQDFFSKRKEEIFEHEKRIIPTTKVFSTSSIVKVSKYYYYTHIFPESFLLLAASVMADHP